MHSLRGMSGLKDKNSDKCWSCSHSLARLKENRHSHSVPNNALDASEKVAYTAYTAIAGKLTGG